jgi:hypothetical protein
MDSPYHPLASPVAHACNAGPGVQLVITDRHEKQTIVELIAASALRGPLCIIAGSEWLPSYMVAHSIRRSTVELGRVLNNVRLARAFTCYQLLDLLAAAPADGTPVLVLDFLHTFFTPDIPSSIRLRTLRECCHHLRQLAPHQPVTVFALREAVKDYEIFHRILAASADEVLQPVAEEATLWQHALL